MINLAIGGGKSYALCGEAIRECIEVPGNRVLLARKESVSFKNTTLITLLRLLPSGVIHRKVEQQFIFPNGSVILYTGLGSEKDNEKIRGLEIGFLGIDEASEVDRSTFEVAASRLRWKPAMDAGRIKVRLTSNPSVCWLKEDFIDAPKWGPKRDEVTQEPILDENGDVILEQKYFYIKSTMKDNPHLAAEYEAQAEDLYSDNPAWKEAFLNGDWDALTGDNQIIDTWQISDAMKRTVAPGTPVIWGLDIARFGSDSTVLFECAGSKFRMVKQWKKKDLDVWGPEVLQYYKEAKVKPTVINIDDIGIGGLAVGYFKMNGLPVKGINVTRQSVHNSNKYANMKAEIWFNLRHRFAEEELDIPNNTTLSIELGAMKFEYQSGRIMIPDKDKIRKNLGRSPDMADAFVLSSWGGSVSFVLFDTDQELAPTLPEVASDIMSDDDADRTKVKLSRFLKGRF